MSSSDEEKQVLGSEALGGAPYLSATCEHRWFIYF